MPKRIVKDTIVLYRNGKQVVPEIGKEFDFTSDELKEINKLNKVAVEHIVTTDPAPMETAKVPSEKGSK